MMLFACAVEKELAWMQPRAGVEILLAGVGPVEAAASVSRALASRSYSLVVNAGIAGAFPNAADVGAGVVVSHDGMELDLETGAALALPGGAALHASARSDEKLVDALRRGGLPALRGVTVSRVTASETTANRLRSQGAQVESMEGFAVLRAAQIAGVRAIQLRGISNIVGPRERSRWSFAAGIAGLRHAVDVLFAALAEMPES